MGFETKASWLHNANSSFHDATSATQMSGEILLRLNTTKNTRTARNFQGIEKRGSSLLVSHSSCMHDCRIHLNKKWKNEKKNEKMKKKSENRKKKRKKNEKHEKMKKMEK